MRKFSELPEAAQKYALQFGSMRAMAREWVLDVEDNRGASKLYMNADEAGDPDGCLLYWAEVAYEQRKLKKEKA